MLVLDTDLLTIVQFQSGDTYRRLDERLYRVYESELIAVTIVSLEEQTRGWLAYLNKKTAKEDERLIKGYDRLHELLKDYENRNVLDFDEAAYMHYRILKTRVRIGAMDLRIAGIVLANNATLLTRNVRDFAKVPELKIEDWSK